MRSSATYITRANIVDFISYVVPYKSTPVECQNYALTFKKALKASPNSFLKKKLKIMQKSPVLARNLILKLNGKGILAINRILARVKFNKKFK